MKPDPYAVVRQFEQAVAEYTGAPYCVAVSSCTMALLLAVKWMFRYDADFATVNIPKRTYISVPMSIIHAGGTVSFRDEVWSGAYQLKPYPIWDAARTFTSDMFKDWHEASGQEHAYVCTSFQASKILGDTQGGAILHNDSDADAWFRRMRFDGRTEGLAPKDDTFTEIGYHCYLSPDVAARLYLKLYSLPRHNPDLPNDDYPDLSRFTVFSDEMAI